MSDKPQFVGKNALDNFTYALNARKTEINARNPCIIFKPNVPKQPQYADVTVTLMHFIRGEQKTSFDVGVKPAIIHAALKRLEKFADIPYESDEKPTMSWPLMGPKMQNGKITGEISNKGTLVVGRNKQGVFISLVSWNKDMPKIAFFPGTFDDRNTKAPNGDDDPEALYNHVCATAVGWASGLAGMLNLELHTHINRALDRLRAANGNNGGGNSGGGQRSSGGSYGGGNSYSNDGGTSSDDGDDFNF